MFAYIFMFFRRSTVVFCLCSFTTTKQLSKTTTAAFIPKYSSRSTTFRHLSSTSSSIGAIRNLNNNFLRKQQHQGCTTGVFFIVSHKLYESHQRTMTSTTDNNDINACEQLIEVGKQYEQVRDRVQAIASAEGRDNVRLVAVSKTKPMSLLEAAYSSGCRHFGENYVQELVEKVETWQSDNTKTGVQWHFIGALQSNKCQTLVSCCNDINQLTVETVSSVKLATKLNTAVSNKLSSLSVSVDDSVPPTPPQRLKVFVQVNTSGEDSKSGIETGDACVELCRYILLECPLLELRGLMTIGAPGDTSSFTTLVQCRDVVLSDLTKIEGIVMPTPFELSMGMSDDFEQAIQAGSTNVRVGSTIFGRRNYST